MSLPITFPAPVSRLHLIAGAILLLLLSSMPSSAADNEGETRPPHVIVITAENLGYGALSSQGGRGDPTTHLDSIAEDGVRLSRFYAAPDRGPALAGLLTGRYPYRTGAAGSTHGEGTFHAHETTLPKIFQDHGWSTGCFGDWFSGSNWPHTPEARGFELSHRADTPATTVDHALTFFDRQLDAGRRFFGQLIFGAPVEISEIDAATGRLLAWLDARRISGDTLVWFLSTNGPETVASPADNAYLRGACGSVHEGGVRVPSLVRWTGKIPPATEFRRLTAQIDVLPTLLDLCGIETTRLDTRPPDGISLAPALLSSGQPDRWPNRILFTSWTPPGYDTRQASVAVRTDRWLAIRDPRWRRGTPSETHSGWELYDLNADPYQRLDLADDYPFLLSDMRADFSRWMDHTTDHGLGPLPTEIGHPEWPVVTLRREDAPFRAPDQPRALAWPLTTKTGIGARRVRIVADQPGGRFVLKLDDREHPFTIEKTEHDLGILDFPEGESVVTLESTTSGDFLDLIRSVIISPP